MSQEQIKTTLLAAIENVKSNPGSAKLVFRASTRLAEGMQCFGKVRDFPEISIDEPPELGGTDHGPNPVEIILVALGTCQEIVYRAYAAVMGIELESVKVDVRGYLDLHGLFALDDSIPAGYQKVIFETEIKSSASREQLTQLAKMVESHCPVLNTLQAPVEVVGKVVANGQELGLDAAA